MLAQQLSQVCKYRYDPLDRLISDVQPDASVNQRFYCKSRLATEIQGAICQTIFQYGDQILAQQQRQDNVIGTVLLSTDQQRSVMQALKKNHLPRPLAYSPYGHHRAESGLSSLLSFNGERADRITGHYLLGNGYRAFNPVLMRFNSPDSWSPFGRGGLNAYGYCAGNPVNRVDPTGHMVLGVKGLLSILPSNNKGSFLGYYVGAKAPLLSLKNGDTLAGAAMHGNGARLGPGLYSTTDKKIADAFLRRADPKSGAKMFGVHHTGELNVRPYGPGLHPDADLQTIAQSGTTYRIPSTQYDNLIFTEALGPGPASGIAAVPSPSKGPGIGPGPSGGSAAAASVTSGSGAVPSARIPPPPALSVEQLLRQALQMQFEVAAFGRGRAPLQRQIVFVRGGARAPGA
ncbi:RHS repeat-associated core domain-containing protein [Pseudomonas moorei]|jgi:RHS repeat-associated protein|uniref:RHS repeat-associated core domain-containing protein n=1 Tax=Pseudomonas moorei TaxID=395599 RepID=UPI0036F32627